VLQAPLNGRSGVLRFDDLNFPGRAGWKEIVASGGTGVRLRAASVGTASRSHDLTIYPSSVVSSPPQDLSATLSIEPGPTAGSGWASPAAAIREAEAPLLGPHGGWSALAKGLTRAGPNQSQQTGWASSRNDPLTALIGSHDLPLGLLLLSLVVAFWFGAGHALSPGHGKTIVAAYLVGNRGTWAQAAILGLTVTATHTAGVFALGLVTLYLSSFILPDQLYPWLGFISGMLVSGMGVTLCVRRFRALRRPGRVRPVQAHGQIPGFGGRHARLNGAPVPATVHVEPAVHRHGPFGRPHTHAPTTPGGVSLRSLLALGVSGGLLPCPSALVVLLSAIAFHRLVFGMVLIVAFSLGLACTLTGVGLLAVYGGRIMARLGGSRGRETAPLLGAIRVLPVISALIVAALGSAIALGALSPGLLPSVFTRI
jgi:ABC-type nickel/cobalt efflux system permease component RcnA